MYIFRKAVRRKFIKDDLILGTQSAASLRIKHLQLKKTKLFERQKLFLKRIIFSYNQLNLKKLKKLGFLASKSRIGTINYFFYLLEGRLDNILIRFNLGSRFYVKHFIQAKNVLINNKCISTINFIVKEFSYISFIKTKKTFLYNLLKYKLKNRLFMTQPPYYLEINYKILTLLIIPKFLYPSYIPYPFFQTRSTLVNGLHTVLWGW